MQVVAKTISSGLHLGPLAFGAPSVMLPFGRGRRSGRLYPVNRMAPSLVLRTFKYRPTTGVGTGVIFLQRSPHPQWRRDPIG